MLFLHQSIAYVMLKPKNSFKIFEIHWRGKISCKHMPKYAKICIVMVYSVCSIASQEVQTMKRNRFYRESKFAKRDANCQNNLAMC